MNDIRNFRSQWVNTRILINRRGRASFSVVNTINNQVDPRTLFVLCVHPPPSPTFPPPPRPSGGESPPSSPPFLLIHPPPPFSCTPPEELFLRNKGRAVDDFSWEAVNDPSRCSLLIHEVSLLVGLAPDDGYPPPDDTRLAISDRSKKVPDILPLTLTPTKSLAPRKHRNRHTDTNVQVHPSNIPMLPNINPRPDIPNPTLHIDTVAPVRSTDPVTPSARHNKADSVRPSLSPRRRQGQVFLFEPPLGDASRRNAVHLDETFLHPREPPPKPTPNSLANRCSSLDRLERSLLKLEAHAPRNHRKSQSEGDHVTQRKDTRPPLPPPRRLRKEQSSYEIMHRNTSRPALGRHSADPPPPVPRPTPVPHHVAPLIFPAVPSDGELTPTSFMDMDMDMDIPCTENSQKRQTSFPQLKSKERMQYLVRVAKRASRGVIALGKNLTGSTKPAQETTTVRNSRV